MNKWIIEDNFEYQHMSYQGLTSRQQINIQYYIEQALKIFTKEKGLFMERKLLEHLVAFKIQTYWRRANYNPGYELCKRRLMRECDMFGIE